MDTPSALSNPDGTAHAPPKRGLFGWSRKKARSRAVYALHIASMVAVMAVLVGVMALAIHMRQSAPDVDTNLISAVGLVAVVAHCVFGMWINWRDDLAIYREEHGKPRDETFRQLTVRKLREWGAMSLYMLVLLAVLGVVVAVGTYLSWWIPAAVGAVFVAFLAWVTIATWDQTTAKEPAGSTSSRAVTRP